MTHYKHRKSAFRNARASVAAVVVLAACGGAPATTTPKVDLAAVKCAPVAGSGLGEGDVCVDSGIRSTSLFSFANWGGRRYEADDFGFQELIALYGDSVVCANAGQSQCDVTPKARMMRTVIDNMLQNGRCEGLSALGALYMTSRGPDPARFGAGAVQSLTPAQTDFVNIIDYWWSTQILDGVVLHSKSSRKSGVRGVLATVLDGLSNKKGVTVGLYSDQGAHSVLPVAVTRAGDNLYTVHVWDSNNPRVLGQLSLDIEGSKWSYANGRLNSGSAVTTWEGTDGSIDAVALDARAGKPLMDLGTKGKGTASITASTSSNQQISLTVKTSDGKQLVASSTGATGAIPGAEVTPLRTGDVNQVLVTLPTGTSDYSVSLEVSASGGNGTGTSQVTVDSGSARALSAVLPADGKQAAIDITATTKDGEASFSTVSPQNSVVTATSDSSVLSVPLEPRESLSVSTATNEKVDSVVVIDPAGGPARTVEVAAPVAGSSQDVVLVRTTEGEFQAVATRAVPVAIDRTAVTGLSATTESASLAVTPAAAQKVSISSSAGATGDTTTTVTSRVTSDSAGTAWLEYGPDDNWADSVTSPRKTVDAGVDTEVSFPLQKLTPGTSYRYRTGYEVDGFVVYSAFSTIDTTGDAPDAFGAVVSPSNIKVTSSLVAATNTGAVVASKVSVPVAARAWIEYVLDSNPTNVVRTPAQPVRKGTDVQVISVVNGLSTGQSYRFRVAVQVQESTGYSAQISLTTGTTVATDRLNVSAIAPEFSFSLEDVTPTTANVAVVINGVTPGKVQAEILGDATVATRRSAAVPFVAGKNVRVVIPLAFLTPGTSYNVRILVNSAGLTLYGPHRTLVTAVPASTDNSGGRLDAPVVPASTMSGTEVFFQAAVRSDGDGSFHFQYGIDNSSVEATYTTTAVQVQPGARTIGPTSSNPVLRAGTPYRVRSVLVIGTQTYTSAYTRFTTPGNLDYSVYRASAPNLRRTTNGADVSWSVGAADVPSIITYKVLDGSTVLCTVEPPKLGCDATINEYGSRSILVATFAGGTEVARGPASTISIGGTPTVSAFSLVTATTNSLSFTYSFNPRGETVQYGIEVRTPQDQFVKADLGGTTSAAVNGAVHQVSGLTAATAYKVRLVLIYGNLTAASDWMTVTTS